jgi:hypothetical protein
MWSIMSVLFTWGPLGGARCGALLRLSYCLQPAGAWIARRTWREHYSRRSEQCQGALPLPATSK